MRYLSVALAGAVGALSRHLLGLWIIALLPSPFPLHTLLINLTGSLLLGFVAGFGIERGHLPEPWRLPVTVGLIGSYTTFSTWSVETVLLLETGRWGLALLNVAASLALGLAAVWLGHTLAHRIGAEPQRSR
ncbi:MAG: fluoride efflux transporter CrcB [Bacillota bacterium]